MCGFAGYLELRDRSGRDALIKNAETMGNTLVYRGPDASGTWADEISGIALAHQRLSIIDLSEAGAQPMHSVSGRYIIAYNGEVYNHTDLREGLEQSGHRFKGHSDTEVILAAVEQWGLNTSLHRFIGMFAFALWDRQEKRLSLVRDRLGIKPVYWTKTPNVILFGSELKALRAHQNCPTEINRDSIALYLRHNYIPAPHTIYQGINKLEPGTIAQISAKGDIEINRYWALKDHVLRGKEFPFQGGDEEATNQLESLLKDSIRKRMISDVPLGVFLSGGVDSSTIAALMQAQSSAPIKSFSIGFEEGVFNESKHAEQVANHLQTDHTELTVTSKDARDVIPKLPYLFDEPFSDSSQIPTYLLSKLTRSHVTVALSGDGGDELFCGYTRYLDAIRFQSFAKWHPQILRQLEATGIKSVPLGVWNTLGRQLHLSKSGIPFGDRLYKMADILTGSADDFYLRLLTHWEAPNKIAINATEPKGIIWDPELHSITPQLLARMQYIDACTYLPDDILTKVDRASMAASLEARIPLLDHRIVEFAWSLPSHMKLRKSKGKWLLREVLHRYVPEAMINRPKKGFAIPLSTWLRGPLKEWAGDMLSPERLKHSGLINSEPIQKKWQEHIAGERNWHYLIWDVLMLESWNENWG